MPESDPFNINREDASLGMDLVMQGLIQHANAGTLLPLEYTERHPYDADDVAVFIAGLLKRAGARTRLVVVSQDPHKPFHHVFVEVWYERAQTWVPLDPLRPAPDFPKRREYDVEDRLAIEMQKFGPKPKENKMNLPENKLTIDEVLALDPDDILEYCRALAKDEIIELYHPAIALLVETDVQGVARLKAKTVVDYIVNQWLE